MDREILIDALSRYLNPVADARRFDWLYKDNPHGEAQVWIAFDRGEWIERWICRSVSPPGVL